MELRNPDDPLEVVGTTRSRRREMLGRNTTALFVMPAVFLVAGCASNETIGSNDPTEASITTTTEVEPTHDTSRILDNEVDASQCNTRKVYPGKYFDSQRSGRIERQLAMLSSLKTDDKITTKDVTITLPELLISAYLDPVFAEAIDELIKLPAETDISVDEFLELPTSALNGCVSNDGVRLSQKDTNAHSFYFRSIGDYTLDTASDKVTEQSSDLLQKWLNKAKNVYKKLESDLDKVLTKPEN